MRNLTVIEVKCEVIAGGEIGATIVEACIMALTEKRTVTFSHNGRDYVVKPEELANLIYKQHE